MKLWRRKPKLVNVWEENKKRFPTALLNYDEAVQWKHRPPGIQTTWDYGMEMATRAVIAKERHRERQSVYFTQLLASARREFLDYLDRDVHP